MMRLGTLVRTWPTAAWLEWFDRRLGLYLVTIAAVVGLKWRNGYDLNAFLSAARDVAAGGGAYDATLATGVGEWGVKQVYISPPFLAHVLAPISSASGEVVFVAWAALGLMAVALAIRSIDGATLARRMPRLVFALAYVWACVFLGQVNLFVLAGLLVALACRRDWLAGFGLAIAVLLRGTPLAFAVVIVVDRRWKTLLWAAAWFVLGVLASDPREWLTFVGVLRDAAILPPLDVPPQASLAYFAPLLRPVALVLVVIVLLLAHRVPDERNLLLASAIGMSLVLLPGNSWYHWYAFAIVGLLLWGDRALWGRRILVAFLAVGFILLGWPSSVVALVALVAMVVRVLVPGTAVRSESDTRSLALG